MGRNHIRCTYICSTVHIWAEIAKVVLTYVVQLIFWAEITFHILTYVVQSIFGHSEFLCQELHIISSWPQESDALQVVSSSLYRWSLSSQTGTPPSGEFLTGHTPYSQCWSAITNVYNMLYKIYGETGSTTCMYIILFLNTIYIHKVKK